MIAPVTTSLKQGQLRHKCPGGHQRLVARIVGDQLEFQCDNCKEKFYWSVEFLQMLTFMIKTHSEFLFVFE